MTVTVSTRLPFVLSVATSSVVRSVTPSPSKSCATVFVSASSDCVWVVLVRSELSAFRTSMVEDVVPFPLTVIVLVRTVSAVPSPSSSTEIVFVRPSALNVSTVDVLSDPSALSISVVSVREPPPAITIVCEIDVSAVPSLSSSMSSVRLSPVDETLSSTSAMTLPSSARFSTRISSAPPVVSVRVSR